MARAVARRRASVAVWGRKRRRTRSRPSQLAAGWASGPSRWSWTWPTRRRRATTGATSSPVRAVDTLIANAGVTGGGPFVDQPLGAVASRDVGQPRRRVPLLPRRGRGTWSSAVGRGRWCGVSSTSAIHGASANEAYSASKTAVLSLVRGVAVELARTASGSTASMPGWTETELTEPLLGWEKFMTNTTDRTPVRRWGIPEDIGRRRGVPRGSDALFHTGDCLVVDGGYTVYLTHQGSAATVVPAVGSGPVRDAFAGSRDQGVRA